MIFRRRTRSLKEVCVFGTFVVMLLSFPKTRPVSLCTERSPGGVNVPGLTDCGLPRSLVVISPEYGSHRGSCAVLPLGLSPNCFRLTRFAAAAATWLRLLGTGMLEAGLKLLRLKWETSDISSIGDTPSSSSW